MFINHVLTLKNMIDIPFPFTQDMVNRYLRGDTTSETVKTIMRTQHECDEKDCKKGDDIIIILDENGNIVLKKKEQREEKREHKPH